MGGACWIGFADQVSDSDLTRSVQSATLRIVPAFRGLCPFRVSSRVPYPSPFRVTRRVLSPVKDEILLSIVCRRACFRPSPWTEARVPPGPTQGCLVKEVCVCVCVSVCAAWSHPRLPGQGVCVCQGGVVCVCVCVCVCVLPVPTQGSARVLLSTVRGGFVCVCAAK